MNYRLLGKSGFSISEIGFGCMSLGKEDTENTVLIHRAIDSGINFFDTADMYSQGQNEKTVGLALAEKRTTVFISTKVGNQWREDGSGTNWNPSKKYILLAAEESLKRLQTDYIDLYQLHGGTMDDDMDDTIAAFELLKSQGKIRAYGISSIRPNVIREYVQRAAIVSVMLQYSLLDRRPEESCLNLLKENNIGVLSRGSLAKGLLADKPTTLFLNYTMEEVTAAANAIKSVSGDKRTAAQTATRFVLHKQAISSSVAGIRTIAQLDELVNTMATPILSEKEYALLQRAISKNVYDQYR